MSDRLELAGLLREAAWMGREINRLRNHDGIHVEATGIGSPMAMEREAAEIENAESLVGSDDYTGLARKRMCAAEAKLAPWGSVYCTKSTGHQGQHHAYDALIDHRWPASALDLDDPRHDANVIPCDD